MPLNKNAIMRFKIMDELLSSRYHNYTLDDYFVLKISLYLPKISVLCNSQKIKRICSKAVLLPGQAWLSPWCSLPFSASELGVIPFRSFSA